MKLESQTISLAEKGPSLEITASPFLDLVHAFKDAIREDESGASYRVIRAMAMSETDILPKNRNEYPGNKLTKTQEWAAQLVRLAAKDVVLETEGERAFPNEMGLGTRLESEASVLQSKLNFGYLGDPKVVFDPETGVKLDMTYAADYIRILRTYLPTRRELAITGGALALAAVMAACSSGTDRSTPTTIPDASPTSPRVTEVFTPTTAPTETHPAATAIATGVPPTHTPDVSSTPAASATVEAKPTTVPVESLMTREQIQANIDKFENMTDAEFQVQVERLFFANDGSSPGSYKDVSLLDMKDGHRIGPAHQHRLGIIGENYLVGDTNPDKAYKLYPVEGVLLGIQTVRDSVENLDVNVLWLGTVDGSGRRIVAPLYYGYGVDAPTNRLGYYLENTANYDTKTVNGEVIEQRNYPPGITDLVKPYNDVLRNKLLPRVGDVIIVKMSVIPNSYVPPTNVPDWEKNIVAVAVNASKTAEKLAQELIQLQAGTSSAHDVTDALPKFPLPDAVTPDQLYGIPNGTGSVIIAEPILSFGGK